MSEIREGDQRPPLVVDVIIKEVKVVECPECGRKLRFVISHVPAK